MKYLLLLFSITASLLSSYAETTPLVTNIYSRNNLSLNGKWNYIIDPLENGYYDYRLKPFANGGFFQNRKAEKPGDLIEYNFDTSPIMDIPSDWNMKNSQLFFYEGTVWFKKDFVLKKNANSKYIIYFGAVNYEAIVYVNGKFAGKHIGGYTPFNFDITDIVKNGNNFVVVKVDNKRHKDNVPTVNMDWWNYGGITREVFVSELPETYIEDYSVQYKSNNVIYGWVKLNNPTANVPVTVEIPELKLKKQAQTDADGKMQFELKAKPQLWSPESPKLYNVQISKPDEKIADEIGFRTIETRDKDILLNGKKVFLRGISIHEEAPYRQGRAWSKDDARTLLGWAKELGCNYVRLAHYPHNENMVREAEKIGLMVWSEIPVYWTISWENQETFDNAKNQLEDMITRDRNRSAVIIWSISNETPHSEARDKFLINLTQRARQLDNTRQISMAMEVATSENNLNRLSDNMNEYVDVLSFNQYLGWYRGSLDALNTANWEIPYNKPVIISEFGAGALQGYYGDVNQRFTEEYQEELYIRSLKMFERIEGLSGISPWILVDFYSPRRQLFGIQDFFNRKGLVSSSGNKKKAFYILQDWYSKKIND